MAMDPRISLTGAATMIVCSVVVILRVALAPTPIPRRHGTEWQRHEIAEVIALSEQQWVIETRQNFPMDSWSQRDDFHGREYVKINSLIKEKHVRVEDILRAIDDDIHLHRAANGDAADYRNARAVPCKPRPFYD